MNRPHSLLKGTFLLTLAALIARLAGFYYKIFLSHKIGAQAIGLFQLTIPLYTFCLALSCGGIQTAVSHFTAAYLAQRKLLCARRILLCSLFLTLLPACLCAALLYTKADWFAGRILLEQRCAGLIRIIAFALPFSALHGCLNGYMIGSKKNGLSAAGQLTEQAVRISAAMLSVFFMLKNGQTPTAAIMALGELAGELSAALFGLSVLILQKKGSRQEKRRLNQELPWRGACRHLFSMALPLSLTRILLCILQAAESSLLLRQLQKSGETAANALSSFGTLTGMALPLLLFPTAATGALSIVLLPAISETSALKQSSRQDNLIRAAFYGSLYLGYFFLTAFKLFGSAAGTFLFRSESAGIYIRKLALLCPFLYLNTTLSSVLHGLGKTAASSACAVFASCIRLCFVCVLVPVNGINACFAGMFFSAAWSALCTCRLLYKNTSFRIDLSLAVLRPVLLCIAGSAPVLLLQRSAPSFFADTFLGVVCCAAVFLLFLLLPAPALLSPLFCAKQSLRDAGKQ